MQYIKVKSIQIFDNGSLFFEKNNYLKFRVIKIVKKNNKKIAFFNQYKFKHFSIVKSKFMSLK